MNKTNLSPIILVDGSSYLFRAYHVPYLQALSTSDGQPTGAITGVLNMIKSLQKEYPQGNVVVVFDAKGKTFRNDMYPEYKANRPPMPEDLRSQIAPLHEIIEAMGLPLLVIEGVEADDVIGTLAHQADQKGIDTIISTGDKDMAQLVTPHVSLINTMTNTAMDVDGVVEKFGVRADQIIDYLALMGDKVDNIPGVDKCGPKTAVKWLTEYKTLNGVIENADKIKGKIGENLRSAIERLPLSYDLATIKLDVELEQSVDQILPTAPNTEKLEKLYSQFELKRLLAELKAGDKVGTQQIADDSEEDEPLPEKLDAEYDIILTDEAFDTFLRNAGYPSLDVNDVPVSDLRNILLYHVLGTEVNSSSLSDTYVNTLATNAPNDEPLSLQVNVTGGVTFDGNAAPVAVDVMASNGIVHVIDAVMTPNNVVEFALNNDNFSDLVSALTDSRHTTDFVEILTGNGPFTVFAPTNLAFQKLIDSNTSWNTLGDIPIETLDAVLKYHVVNGANVQADQLVDGAKVETFQGTDITIDLTTGAQIKTSTQTVNILVGAATNDVQGTNGVIHAIDAVLLP